MVAEWPSRGPGVERIALWIDWPEFQGKPAVVALSRFSPVTLARGEYALILRHRSNIPDRKHADFIKEASIVFSVGSRFAGPKDWWRGTLVAYGDIKRLRDPDKQITENTANDKRYRAELADPNFLKNVPARAAAMMASADHVGFRGEEEKKNRETFLRDPAWIRRMSDAVAKVSITDRDNCLCSGWRTAYFYKGDEMVISVAAINGKQLRIYWKGSGGDFPVAEDEWKAVNEILEEGYKISSPAAMSVPHTAPDDGTQEARKK